MSNQPPPTDSPMRTDWTKVITYVPREVYDQLLTLSLQERRSLRDQAAVLLELGMRVYGKDRDPETGRYLPKAGSR